MAWNPFWNIERELDEMRRRFESGMPVDPMMSGGRPMREPGLQRPFVDLMDQDGEFLVTADLPGVDKEDIRVRVEGNDLVIRADAKREKEEEERGYVYRERAMRAFHRRIPLPSNVDAKKASSSFRNGVLEIHLPKTRTEEGEEIRIE